MSFCSISYYSQAGSVYVTFFMRLKTNGGKDLHKLFCEKNKIKLHRLFIS